MNSGTQTLQDGSTSGSISSTNHLSPLLKTRGSEGLFGTLWRRLTSFTSALCKLQALATSSNHSVDPVHVKISCHQVHTRRFVRSQRSHSPSTVHTPSCCHHIDSHERFSQAVRSTRPYVNTCSAAMLECTVDFLVVVVAIGPSTAFLANQAPVYCGCPAGTHGCDPVSRVRLDQSANPVVVWLGLVSRVVRSSWSHGAFVH